MTTTGSLRRERNRERGGEQLNDCDSTVSVRDQSKSPAVVERQPPGGPRCIDQTENAVVAAVAIDIDRLNAAGVFQIDNCQATSAETDVGESFRPLKLDARRLAGESDDRKQCRIAGCGKAVELQRAVRATGEGGKVEGFRVDQCAVPVQVHRVRRERRNAACGIFRRHAATARDGCGVEHRQAGCTGHEQPVAESNDLTRTFCAVRISRSQSAAWIRRNNRNGLTERDARHADVLDGDERTIVGVHDHGARRSAERRHRTRRRRAGPLGDLRRADRNGRTWCGDVETLHDSGRRLRPAGNDGKRARASRTGSIDDRGLRQKGNAASSARNRNL